MFDEQVEALSCSEECSMLSFNLVVVAVQS